MDQSGPGPFKIKGRIQQIDGGRVKRKIRVPSFETVEAPVGKTARSLDKGILGRNIYEGTGEVGNMKQIYMRETTTFTEIIPVVFLQDAEGGSWIRAAVTRKGSFCFEGLPEGNYRVSIEVPGYTPVVRELLINSGNVDKNGEFDFDYSFRPADPEETRLLKAHYNPKSVSSRARAEYDRGVKDLEENRPEEALVRFEMATAHDEFFTEALERMGMIHLSRGALDLAEEAFRKALATDPYSYRSLSNLGTILLNRQEGAESFGYCELAVRVRPQDPQARYHLAMSCYQLDRLDQALAELQKEKVLEPSHFTQPQLLSAEIYRLTKNYDAMIRELEDFLSAYPADPKGEQVRQALEEAKRSAADRETDSGR